MKRTSVVRVAGNAATRILHGGDYNPDQWLDSPKVLDEDLRLMKLAKVNVVSLGIFAWVAIEPEEGRFTFDWMDEVIGRLAHAGVGVFLATPTGARPAWLSQNYPEVLRVQPNRVRNLHGGRHNHCYTSPAYRARTAVINGELARRYASNPAVQLWHLSNEYGGECHCPLCQDAFRGWLKERYAGDLDRLNAAWWTSFWSHTYTDWSQVESPAPHGERAVHGHNLDWKRFVTHQTRSFMRHEIESIRAVDSSVPFTTNLMGFYPELDYFKIALDIDVVSWDSYPAWGGPGSASASQPADAELALQIGTAHDLMRGCRRDRPFLLMESTPSMTNWMPVAKLKRPGVHLASSMLAVAHGADSVQYFQWRKSRGSSEKFHGAVVDHVGHEHTRVFSDVADTGVALESLREVAGAHYPAEVAVIFDWENRWAINDAQGPRNDGRKAYEETVQRHAAAFSRLAVNVDLVDSEQDISRYKIVVAPMLYMVKPGVAERLTEFVRAGGTFVATYWSGIVNESDLCFTEGFPGPLGELLGIWSEEIDALYAGETNTVRMVEPFARGRETGTAAGGAGTPAVYEAHELCDLIHLRGATALAHYERDFYAGRPALTVKEFGRGRAYYIASRNDREFLADFYADLAARVRPVRAFDEPLPPAVHATLRRATNDDGTTSDYRFLINFSSERVCVPPCRHGETIIYRSPPPNGGDGKRLAQTAKDDPGVLDAGVLPAYGVQVRCANRP